MTPAARSTGDVVGGRSDNEPRTEAGRALLDVSIRDLVRTIRAATGVPDSQSVPNATREMFAARILAIEREAAAPPSPAAWAQRTDDLGPLRSTGDEERVFVPEKCFDHVYENSSDRYKADCVVCGHPYRSTCHGNWAATPPSPAAGGLRTERIERVVQAAQWVAKTSPGAPGFIKLWQDLRHAIADYDATEGVQ